MGDYFADEELETVDWYNQRVDPYKNDELKAILARNRDEERTCSYDAGMNTPKGPRSWIKS